MTLYKARAWQSMMGFGSVTTCTYIVAEDINVALALAQRWVSEEGKGRYNLEAIEHVSNAVLA